MLRKPIRVEVLLVAAIAAFALAVPTAAQWGENGDPPDPGFPENGYSYPADYAGSGRNPLPGERNWRSFDGWLDLTAWPPPSWMPHRGNRLYLHLAEKKGQPLQMFQVLDESGAPIAGATVEIQQAGYRVPGVRGVTDDSGSFYVTVQKPNRSHRVRFVAPGHRPLVMEMSGGRLETARHEIVLESGEATEEATVVAYMPEVRSAPPGKVLKSYRRGLEELSKDRYDRAARELRLAVERWPLPSGDTSAGEALYRPYRALEQALEGMGKEELAEVWQRRAEALGESGS